MLCAGVKIFIFAFGQKKDANGSIKIADGMLKELEWAMKNNALIIPIGGTGGTANKIYQDSVKNADASNKIYTQYFIKQQNEFGLDIDIEEKVREYLNCLSKLNSDINQNNMEDIINEIVKIIKVFG